MLARRTFGTSIATLLAGAALFLAGCSSSQPRDIHYGTDAGLGYSPPDLASATGSEDAADTDAENLVDSSSPVDATGVDAMGVDATSVHAQNVDAGTPQDGGVPVDASANGVD